MSELETLTRQLEDKRELSSEQVAAAAAALAAAEVGEPPKVAFLAALTRKGETAAEIAAFARYFRTRAVDPGVGEWSPRAIDIVGTGGDRAGAFNISSLVTLTLASGGVTVMKHGNRAITSSCGSADLLAALGVNLEAPHEKIRGALKELGFCFFFAPAYHPAFKQIAPVRKALAAQNMRSVFNVLGPLINPGRPARTLLGVFSPDLVEKMAAALGELGVDAGLVAHGVIEPGTGVDEMTTATENHIRGVGRLGDLRARWGAEEFGLKVSAFSELQGGDVARNLEITNALLDGRGSRGLVDTITLNAAIGFWLSGVTGEIRDGLGLARELLVGGAVRKKIEATREFYSS